MGFDTGYGGDQQSSGSFFDDPQFLAQLQGAFGGGGPTNLGAGGNAVYSPAQKPMGPVSLPDGSQATSPYAGGGPATPWDQNTGQRIPGGGGGMERPPWMTGGGYGGRMPTEAESGGAPGRGMAQGGATSPFEVGPSSGAPNTLHAAMQPAGGGYGRFPQLRGGGGGRYGGGAGGGWYGGYGNQEGGGQQQWYRPQGSDRPDSSNPGAAYDAGPGRAEARDEAATQPQAPPRWQMPQGGAYGRPMPMQRRRRYYGNSGAPMPAGQGAQGNITAPAAAYAGPAQGGGY